MCSPRDVHTMTRGGELMRWCKLPRRRVLLVGSTSPCSALVESIYVAGRCDIHYHSCWASWTLQIQQSGYHRTCDALRSS
jgi:hypothetical protein